MLVLMGYTAPPPMPTRAIRLGRNREILVRPLANGDVETVSVVFERLGERSRRLRFNGPKPSLSPAELETLATMNAARHALVAYLVGDGRPAAIARLVRSGTSAEIAFAVADEHHGLGIGTALTAELLADARAAGITEITGLVSTDNPAALGVLRRLLGRLEVSFEGAELSIRAVLA
jgi:ribosomal protein S18 acetylase RimI-like enzyme